MQIVDAHEDIAWNVLALGRDVLRGVWETRRLEEGSDTTRHHGQCMVGLPEWLAGGVAVVVGTIFVAPAHSVSGPHLHTYYATAEEAHRLANAQMQTYRRLAERSERIELVEDQASLEDVLRSWEGEAPRVGIVLAMEGADPVRQPAEVEEWYRQGLRVVGLAWAAGSRYAGGDRRPGPLTAEGRELLRAMAAVGVVADLSHISEEAFWEVVERYDGPLVATHANPRAIVDGPRHLSDAMLHALAEREGVVGIVPYNRFLRPGWVRGDSREEVTLGHVAAAVDHVCQLVGDAAHVGLGSDFDGGFGAESSPTGIETVADLGKIAQVLAERGYAAEDIVAVMGGNWLRVLRTALPPD
jgi:membrane dipeptidase